MLLVLLGVPAAAETLTQTVRRDGTRRLVPEFTGPDEALWLLGNPIYLDIAETPAR